MTSRSSRRVAFPLLALVVLSLATALPQSAAAQERRLAHPQVAPGAGRYALVIGNAAYETNPLRNPANDARDMAQALTELGFEVTLGVDQTKRKMEEAIRAFGARLRSGGTGLFYFAGHGVQVAGVNYLVPVGFTIEKEQDVEFECVDARRVLAEMDAAGNGLNIVILDACRNNPFARSFRSAAQGLATMDAPSGTLLAYATAPGSTAKDGEGRNGTYTKELLAALRVPGRKIEDVFKQVRVRVKQESAGRQVPWEASSLEGDFYFAPASGAPPAGEARAVELAYWQSIQNSRDPELFQAYLRRYPAGTFADVAHSRLRELAPAVDPPPRGDRPGGELGEDTVIALSLQTELSSARSLVGDRVMAVVLAPVSAGGRVDGRELIPQGSSVAGRVTAVRAATEHGSPAAIAIEFESIQLPNGATYRLSAELTPADSGARRLLEQERKRVEAGGGRSTVGLIAGTSRVAGSGIEVGLFHGGVVETNHGNENRAAIGAAVGAIIGALSTGPEMEVRPGFQFAVRLLSPFSPTH